MLSMHFCLTSFAAPLYLFFVVTSLFLFVYTCVVILWIWPIISEKWREDWEERRPKREQREDELKRELEQMRKQEGGESESTV